MQNQDFRASGNALWFILIAIALLSALSLAMTRQSGTSSSNLDAEEARIVATQLARQLSTLAGAVQRLQSVNGCSENEISFENAGPSPYNYTNPNAPTAGARAYHCHVFRVEGGGLNDDALPEAAQSPSPALRYWYYTGANSVNGIGPEGPTETLCASNCAELAAAQLDIAEPVCSAYNKLVGVTGIPVDANGVDEAAASSFRGTYGSGTAGNTRVNTGTGDATTALYGKDTACFVNANSPWGPKYTIYKVLIAR